MGSWVRRRKVKIVRREVILTWYNLFAVERVEKWLIEVKLILFRQNEIIIQLIDDIMEKENWLAQHLDSLHLRRGRHFDICLVFKINFKKMIPNDLLLF